MQVRSLKLGTTRYNREKLDGQRAPGEASGRKETQTLDDVVDVVDGVDSRGSRTRPIKKKGAENKKKRPNWSNSNSNNNSNVYETLLSINECIKLKYIVSTLGRSFHYSFTQQMMAEAMKIVEMSKLGKTR